MIVTDVAGHGAPAAMLTGMIKQIFRGGIAEDLGPGAILQRIVAASRLIQYDRHLTAICACVHPLSNRVEYVNAGHPPGFVARDGGAPLRLESTAPLIHPGLPGWHGEPRVVPMNAGDRLVLYTDGLIEARDAAGDTFRHRARRGGPRARGRAGRRRRRDHRGAALSARDLHRRPAARGRPHAHGGAADLIGVGARRQAP